MPSPGSFACSQGVECPVFWEGLTCRGTKGRTRAVRELGAGVGAPRERHCRSWCPWGEEAEGMQKEERSRLDRSMEVGKQLQQRLVVGFSRTHHAAWESRLRPRCNLCKSVPALPPRHPGCRCSVSKGHSHPSLGQQQTLMGSGSRKQSIPGERRHDLGQCFSIFLWPWNSLFK